jgi:FkbM family methyltransferase
MLSRFPHPLLRFLERSVMSAQGKGIAAFSKNKNIEVEVYSGNFSSSSKVIVFDVGANTGEWTDSFLDLYINAEFYLFEPQKALSEYLKTKYSAMSNVPVVNLGIGEVPESRVLFGDVAGSGLASLHQRNLDFFGIDFFELEVVSVVNLDSFCKDNLLSPTIIKLDIEGHEMFALRGAKKILQTTKFVQFEFGGANINSRTFFRDFWYFFSELNFRIYRITKRGLHPIHNYQEQEESFTPTNYLAIRPD